MKLIILSFYLSSVIVFEVSLNVFSNINKVLYFSVVFDCL